MATQRKEYENSYLVDIFKKISNGSCNPDDFDFYINIYFDEILQYIQTGILQNNLKILQEQERLLKRIAQKIDLFEQDNLITSYQIGVLKSIIALTQKHELEIKKNDLDIYVEKLEQNQQLRKMIVILYDKNSIKHQDLADSLNISKSALSNMIKKTQDLDIYSTKHLGKYKYYYSNFRTREVYKRYIDKNLNQRYTQSDVDKIISTIFVVLSNEIKNKKRINYNSIFKHLPYDHNVTKKGVALSIENFVREYNYSIANDYFDSTDLWISCNPSYEDQQYETIALSYFDRKDANYE